MQNYFNEFDPHVAEWLRELMRDGHLEAGEVDERSIKDVAADDLRRFGACHFFAGIGGWPLALGLAGWPASRPVWTGSCPCQPYSSAGKQQGDADERNLWPDFFRLIRECRPECVFGEQVEGAIRHGWLDRVCADLEGEGYTVGACVLGAHSAGAPHIRQRLYWVAHTVRATSERHAGRFSAQEAGERCPRALNGDQPDGLGDCGSARDMAHSESERCGSRRVREQGERGEDEPLGLRVARGVTQGDTASNGRAEGCDDGVTLHDRPLRDGKSELGGTGSIGGGVGHAESGGAGSEEQRGRLHGTERASGVSVVGNTEHGRREGRDETGERAGPTLPSSNVGVTQGDANGTGPQIEQAPGPGEGGAVGRAGSVGFWSSFDLLPCRDGKARRVEPGTFPLASGVPGRVGLLRGYGNAICVPTATAFVKAFLEAEAEGCVK